MAVDKGVNIDVAEGAAAANEPGGDSGGGDAVDIAVLVVDVVMVVAMPGGVVDVAMTGGIVCGSLEIDVLLCRNAKGSSKCERTSPGGGGRGRKSATLFFSILALAILSDRARLSFGVRSFASVLSEAVSLPFGIDAIAFLAAIHFRF